MTPVRLEPTTLRSRVKHSTTEPLRSPLDLRLKYESRDCRVPITCTSMYLQAVDSSQKLSYLYLHCFFKNRIYQCEASDVDPDLNAASCGIQLIPTLLAN